MSLTRSVHSCRGGKVIRVGPFTRHFRLTKKKKSRLTFCEDLDIGEHQTDAARKLGCSLRTLRNHTNKTVNWRFPPRKDVGHTDAVSRKRLAFVRECLTPSGHLRQKIRDATWLDHKWVNLYGHNRSHQRQARRFFLSAKINRSFFFSKKNRSLFLYNIFVISTLFSEQQRFFACSCTQKRRGSKKPMRPVLRAQHNPKVMCMFAANRWDKAHGVPQVPQSKRIRLPTKPPWSLRGPLGCSKTPKERKRATFRKSTWHIRRFFTYLGEKLEIPKNTMETCELCRFRSSRRFVCFQRIVHDL